MRVSPVINYCKNNKVNFGRFADDNAREVVKKALATDDKVMKSAYDSWFNSIEKCDFFEAYTDKEDNTVKGRFDDEFVKENTSDSDTYGHRFIKRNLDMLKNFGVLDDLSVFGNLEDIATYLYDFKKALKGINLADECRSENPHGDARDEEQAREDFLNNLAD